MEVWGWRGRTASTEFVGGKFNRCTIINHSPGSFFFWGAETDEDLGEGPAPVWWIIVMGFVWRLRETERWTLIYIKKHLVVWENIFIHS